MNASRMVAAFMSIANSQPRIKAVFDNWRLSGGTKDTFLSQLEKNQDVIFYIASVFTRR